MERIDIHPTHTANGYKLRCGQPFPFGATIVPGELIFPFTLAIAPLAP
ncbi:hypothetical protein NON20_12755 [Synechocystis sp. B12]|nr:hypothetical protein NON20_12755 [Synechocystis sp. B12]